MRANHSHTVASRAHVFDLTARRATHVFDSAVGAASPPTRRYTLAGSSPRNLRAADARFPAQGNLQVCIRRIGSMRATGRRGSVSGLRAFAAKSVSSIPSDEAGGATVQASVDFDRPSIGSRSTDGPARTGMTRPVPDLKRPGDSPFSLCDMIAGERLRPAATARPGAPPSRADQRRSGSPLRTSRPSTSCSVRAGWQSRLLDWDQLVRSRQYHLGVRALTEFRFEPLDGRLGLAQPVDEPDVHGADPDHGCLRAAPRRRLTLHGALQAAN